MIDRDHAALSTGTLLKAWCRSRGWTQAQAAGALGVPLRTWQGWAAGKPMPQETMMRHLLLATLDGAPPDGD